MKTTLFVVAFFLCLLHTFAQVYLPITDNMVIGNNANIKFAAGTYTFPDGPADGVIQLQNVQNVILDGDSCFVNGVSKTGYMIKISNAHNVVIKNFDSVFGYKYAVHIMNSDHIIINGNVFCRNKVDSAGWIDVWADYPQALGGGVLMYQSRAAEIANNTMTMQNDGVALYHCDSIRIHHNDFSWNTSYGIRMFWTDSCHIYQNNCAHVNRPLTDPSDCAALLMIISNENLVENNDLSWSGDGVFLGQYQHSNTPNNNRFFWNECSYSPHNAIEATFAGGNIYKHNNCNFSHYGLWLGYSFNTVVDSNEIIGNYQSGIAIDRGFNNGITGNAVKNNPIGIELWEGTPISGYSTFHSQDYRVSSNLFEGNSRAISSVNTKHHRITGNTFRHNQQTSVFFEGVSSTDTLMQNSFIMPTGYHIYNNSANGKYAAENLFIPADTALITAKLYDLNDNPTKGEVIWNPPIPAPPVSLQTAPPCDLAEPGSVWYGYPETGYPPKVKIPDSVYFDSSEVKTGASSLKLVTSRGWDVALNYRPGEDSLSRWELTDLDTLWFWVRTIKQPTYGFQFFSIRLGDDHGNYFKYTASPTLLNAANYLWKQYKVPLSGSPQFSRSMVGTMSLDQVNYVEFHADTWDYGYTLWLDGVQFEPCSPVTGIPEAESVSMPELTCFPNPFRETATIRLTLPETDAIRLEILDITGRRMALLYNGILTAGDHTFTWSETQRLKTTQTISGKNHTVCLLRLTTATTTVTRKLICLPTY